MKYNCEACGKCCENVGVMLDSPQNIPRLEEVVNAFPYEANPDGSCPMLVDGRCSVYEDRPLICRVEELGVWLGVNEKDWYELNKKSCKILRNEKV